MPAKIAVYVAILVLGFSGSIVARAAVDDTAEDDYSANGPIGQDLPNNEEDSPPFQPPRPNPPVLFNEYLLEAYKVTQQVKDTGNCTGIMILNQTVSELFCESNKTVYSFLNANPSERDSRLQNYTYQLCSDVTLHSRDMILSHDFILYLRSPNNVKLDIFFIRTVNETPPWEELVANRSIPVNASGWQVLHLKTGNDPITERRVCVDMFVRQTNSMNQKSLLSQSQIVEKFVLNDCSPSEIANLPFATTYMLHFGTITLPPLFGKRSVGAYPPEQCTRDTKCSLQSHRVNLNDYISGKVLYPLEVDLGECGSREHSSTNSHSYQPPLDNNREEQKGDWESTVGEDLGQTRLYQCIPNTYSSLLVLVNIGGELILEGIPDFVITGCTLQPCSSAA